MMMGLSLSSSEVPPQVLRVNIETNQYTVIFHPRLNVDGGLLIPRALSCGAAYAVGAVVVSFFMCLFKFVWGECSRMVSCYDFVDLAFVRAGLLVV